jgi:hypothetical protein
MCGVYLRLYAGVAVCGVQWVDPTVAVVVGTTPHLLGQLYSHIPVARDNILPMPQVHLAAKVKHQGLVERQGNKQRQRERQRQRETEAERERTIQRSDTLHLSHLADPLSVVLKITQKLIDGIPVYNLCIELKTH